MKKFYIFLITLMIVNTACQQSQFSTTTRQTRNGKVTYSHHHRTERFKRLKPDSKLIRAIHSDAGENRSPDKMDEVNSHELQILKSLPAEISSDDNLTASISINPTMITFNSNKPTVAKNPNFRHRGNRAASGSLLSSILSNKSSHNPVTSAPRSKVETNGLLGFIFSVLGLIPVIGIFFSIAGIIFSGISLYKFKNDQRTYRGKGLAISGLILGIIALIANIILIIALIADMNFSIGGSLSVI